MLTALIIAVTLFVALASNGTDVVGQAVGPPGAQKSAGDCEATFDFSVDWSSGSAGTTLPTNNFSVRKVEAIYYPPDGKTYAYVDIVNYSDLYYPDSYSSEVGVFSSPDGRTGWQYHGIVVPRGPAGAWDCCGIASPGAAVALDGTVLLGYAAESLPSGGNNRGIGLAIAAHPLGPFEKQKTPIADPHTICGGKFGDCDDVIMQSRPGGEIHIYHSVKGHLAETGIRHRMTTDSGKTWSNSTFVLSSRLQPGTEPAETIAGKWFPNACGGRGGMVLITDRFPPRPSVWYLHAYVSKTPGDMTNFVAVKQPKITKHPPNGNVSKGNWAFLQMAFITDESDNPVAVTYGMFTGETVSREHKPNSLGYTHTVYSLKSEQGDGLSTFQV